MIIHDLTVSKQKIFGADNISLAAHANETLALRFHFDRHWKMFDSKAAIFKNHSGQYYIIELHNNIVPVPWEVLTVDEDIEISVIAFEDETVLTTNKVLINVGESLLPEDYQTFCASETLFDWFKRECTAQSFNDYEYEIERLKTGYEERILALGNVINSKDNEINNAQTVKDAEIAQINQQHAEEVTALNSQIAELNSEKAGFKAKADKWDMVDNALKLKTSSAQTLWGNGTDLFALPMMNIPNATVITGSSISNNLTEVGFNLASISSLIEVFKDKSNLKKINLI
ncbi:MAG: hypothetical protein KBT46_03750, partial [Ruminococcus sp.]|nr:hypothetical protein [Candidatus Copronaster equi]